MTSSQGLSKQGELKWLFVHWGSPIGDGLVRFGASIGPLSHDDAVRWFWRGRMHEDGRAMAVLPFNASTTQHQHTLVRHAERVHIPWLSEDEAKSAG